MAEIVVKEGGNMKVAVCLSGQPRFFKKGYECIKENILDVNNCDVFLHCWYSKEPVPGWETGKGDPELHREGIGEEIVNLFQPKHHIIEPQRTNLAKKPYNQYREKPGAPVQVQFSMFYSMKMANELKKKQEKDGEFIYDCVVRMRFDCGILSPLNFLQYPMDKLNYCDVLHGQPGTVCDLLNFGNSEIIDSLCSIYDHMEEYHEAGVGMCGENMMTEHLKLVGIQTNPVPVSLFLIRDKNFNDKSHYGKWWK